jgi:hypothetical protein
VNPPLSRVDHLVVAAHSLTQGVAWCQEVLGVTPAPGGKHPLMGTHNRLLRIANVDFPRCYLEIIAIDPLAPDPGRRRWFDLDDEVLREAVRTQPRLVHFVARTEEATAASRALAHLGIDRGPLLHAERATPGGLLQWQISVRDDGQRLFYGGLPTLIQWGEVHPAATMPGCDITLQALAVVHPRPADLQAAHEAIGLQRVAVRSGPPNLIATLATPRGMVTLESHGA